MKSSLYLATALLSCSLQSEVMASEHSGFWRQVTVKGGSYKCQGINTREGLVSHLRHAGWDVENSIPRINWDTDAAVIVAPANYYRSGNLSFFGLNIENNTLVLSYGWKKIPPSEVVSSGMASFGSVGEGQPATIVVAYKRSLEDGRAFICRNIGLVD